MAPTNKLILMALADIANELGECWPNVNTIARMSCVSDRTVRRTLKVFEASKALHVIPRFTSSGRQTSNRYRLALEISPDKLSSSPVSGQGDRDADVSDPLPRQRQGRTDSAVSPLEPPQNHHSEPPQQPSRKRQSLELPGTEGKQRESTDESAEMPVSALRIPAVLDGARRNSGLSEIARCPAHQRQLVLDEIAGRADRNEVRRPIGLLRSLVDAALSGTFTPNAAIDHAELQERQRTEQRRQDERRNQPPVTPANPAMLAQLKAIRDSIEERRAMAARRPAQGDDK